MSIKRERERERDAEKQKQRREERNKRIYTIAQSLSLFRPKIL